MDATYWVYIDRFRFEREEVRPTPEAEPPEEERLPDSAPPRAFSRPVSRLIERWKTS